MGEAKRRKATGKGTLYDLAIRDRLVRHAFKLTCAALDHSGDDFAGAVRSFYSGRNFSFDAQAAHLSPAAVGCRKGCHACCHQMVICYPFEVFPLAAVLSARAPVDLAPTLAAFHAQLDLPLTPAARYGLRFPCPLLSAGRCSVYDVRPMACRALYSASREACDNALAGLGGDVPYIVEPSVMAAAFNQGIASAIHKKRGLDIEFVEMGGALLTALADVDAAFELWQRGGTPFSAFRVCAPDVPSQAELADRLIARLSL